MSFSLSRRTGIRQLLNDRSPDRWSRPQSEASGTAFGWRAAGIRKPASAHFQCLCSAQHLGRGPILIRRDGSTHVLFVADVSGLRSLPHIDHEFTTRTTGSNRAGHIYGFRRDKLVVSFRTFPGSQRRHETLRLCSYVPRHRPTLRSPLDSDAFPRSGRSTGAGVSHEAQVRLRNFAGHVSPGRLTGDSAPGRINVA